MALKQRDGIRRDQLGDRVHHAADVGQTAALCLGQPLVGVAVAVEDDALMRRQLAADERMQRLLEVLRLFQLVRELGKRVGGDGVEHRIRVRDAAGGRRHAEFKLVAGEGEGRGAVAVARVAADDRQRGHADLHIGHRRDALLAALDDVPDDRRQLIAQEHGDDRRRRLVAAQPMIVARIGRAHAQQTRMLVHRLHHRGEHQQEHVVVLGLLAGREQVAARVRRQAPVVVLAAAVHAGERLFVQQAYQAVAQGNLLHDVHDEHVLIRRQVRGVENRRQLVLGRGRLVVLSLRRDAQLPQLDVQVAHVVAHALLDRAEVVILHLLALGRHRAKERAAGEDQVLAL